MYMSAAVPSASSPPVPARGVWTVSDIEQLDRDGRRYEVLHGELLVTPMPSMRHQEGAGELYRKLADWCDANTGWRCYTPAGLFVSETTWLEPDIAVFPVKRAASMDWKSAPIPVLVVEVLSPSTRHRDRYRKRAACLAHGVGEVWLLDMVARTVERWTSASEFPQLHTDGITWTPVAAAPSLVLKADALFGEIDV